MLYDLIIIGASAAGVSAAVYAKRRNINFLLIAKDVGGEVATSGEIENYLGFPKTDGISLASEFRKQLAYNGIRNEEANVDAIVQGDGFFVVKAKKGEALSEFSTKAVIIASGVHPRKLGIPGEDEYKNKGVSYCTTCDGPLFSGKTVAVIGGGNSALESLLMLATIAKKVYSFNINASFTGEQILIEKVKQLPNVTLITEAVTKKILGDTFVSSLEYERSEGAAQAGYERMRPQGECREGGVESAAQAEYEKKDTGESQMQEVQGVFVHIGMLPNSDFIDFVEKNEFGEIKVNAVCQTSVPGIFAAGDVTNVAYKQISIAAGQGTLALLAAVDYLNKLKVQS